MLNISRNTLDLWLKREQETGECRAITKYQQGCKHKITDWERFKQFAKENGGKTQRQMAALWGEGFWRSWLMVQFLRERGEYVRC